MGKGRAFAAVLLAVSITGTLSSLCAWANNIVFALQWDPCSTERSYWCRNVWLDWSAVDVSTVTTFIPFFGFLQVSVGLITILRRSGSGRKIPVTESFPFFRAYSPVTIAMGLIGTVFGLIMIGYLPDGAGMKQLIHCLNTALYSTLVALLWVYTVLPWLRHGIQRLYYSTCGMALPEGRGTASAALAEMKAGALSLAGTLKEAVGAVEHFIKAMRGMQDHISELLKSITETLRTVKEASEEQRKSAAALAEESEARLAAIRDIEAVQKIVLEELEAERSRRMASEQKLGESMKREEESKKREEGARLAREESDRRAAVSDSERARLSGQLDMIRELVGKEA